MLILLKKLVFVHSSVVVFCLYQVEFFLFLSLAAGHVAAFGIYGFMRNVNHEPHYFIILNISHRHQDLQ
jgi:hypothetical protein